MQVAVLVLGLPSECGECLVCGEVGDQDGGVAGETETEAEANGDVSVPGGGGNGGDDCDCDCDCDCESDCDCSCRMLVYSRPLALIRYSGFISIHNQQDFKIGGGNIETEQVLKCLLVLIKEYS